MTQTLLSLISIVIGISAANTTGYMYTKYSLGIIGDTIAGVFGSIFMIKTFGRLGFEPSAISPDGSFHFFLFIINLIVSYIGGVLGLVVIKLLEKKIKK